jgi:DNA modification methylase
MRRTIMEQTPLFTNHRQPVGAGRSSYSELANSVMNKVGMEDRSVHAWYRFVLSFPPHLVDTYIQRFKLDQTKVLLDPFCGTGTTLVQAKKRGIPSVGIEANPMASFASEVKVDWTPDPAGLKNHVRHIYESVSEEYKTADIFDEPLLKLLSGGGDRILKTLEPEQMKLLLKNSISPLPLHKSLVLLERLRRENHPDFLRHEMLALAKALVNTISNLRFGPEVGVGTIKEDAPVLRLWWEEMAMMADDLDCFKTRASVPSVVHRADSRQLKDPLAPRSIDAVITSPPYPNEKDYTRTTRLELVFLGFLKSRADLQALKKTLVRSNTRSVYKDDDDDHWIAGNERIREIADKIEKRRIELGKTSGFERLYARVTKLYFGGMFRHLHDMRMVLKPGAQLAYVVGDQASYLQVMIRTGEILSDIARSLGYEVVGIDLFRTRLATVTREQLREEVVVLRWPG